MSEWIKTPALDDAVVWLKRYVITTSVEDIWVMALWAQHTWLLGCVPVTPRLLIDSIMPGSGKTTALEHLQRICLDPAQMSQVTSSALLVRLVAERPRTLLLDEVDRSLDPKKETTSDLLAILNSGYKRGATRPVLTPTKGGDWTAKEMATYCAVAMAGNSPRIPDDTRSRALRIFLLPDVNDQAEETDWLDEDFELQALTVGDGLRQWAETYAGQVKEARPTFPDGCKGRLKERWVAFVRIAAVVGGPWPQRVSALIERDMEEERRDREDGMRSIPPTMQAILDVAEIVKDRQFVPTSEIVAKMITDRPDRWGDESSYGRDLTAQRLGKMLAGAGIRSKQEPDGERRRGYAEADVAAVASRLHTNSVNGSNGTNGSNERYPNSSEGSQSNRSNRSKRSDRSDEPDHPENLCPQCSMSLTQRAGTQRCAWRHKQAQAEAGKDGRREG